MVTRKAQGSVATGPSGSIIIWLAGLVFGISAGLLLVYHFLMASRSTSTVPIEVAQPVPAAKAKKAPTLAAASSVNSAHLAAMKEALKKDGP